MTAWADAVIRFWFDELTPEDWFASRPKLDADITRRFGALREDLKRHPPDPATLDAAGLVAAVLVFDQFSRNMFRGSGEAFATDRPALALAEHGIATGLDRTMPVDHRMFLYMPFMHSEDPAVQARSVALFGTLGMPEQVKYAQRQKKIVGRFGRFPARNVALGRSSTEAELAFLEGDQQPDGG
jgi:uncharacterized protein (DUF924 family)